MMMHEKKRKISKIKLSLLLVSIVLAIFIVKVPIDVINKRNKEINDLRSELRESVEKVQDLESRCDDLQYEIYASQYRFESIMNWIMYDYNFNHWNDEE